MKRKIYLIQPTYRDLQSRLLKAGPRLFTHSLAIPALSAAIPSTWEKEYCLEYFEDVNLETDATVIAISCLGYDIFRGRELAEIFQKRGKIVLFGGCASELWRDVIKPVSNAIVCGNPGEAAMADILADAERGELAPEYQCGIDLDYPFDYAILSRKSISRRISLFPAIASAGCPHQCAFCCTAAKFKGCYYPRSLNAVMADLHVLKDIARHFVFVDSNLYGDRNHVVRLSERLIEENLGLTWSAECTIDIGDDPEILRLLRRAGCRALLIGIETLTQHNMDRMQKPFLVEHYREQIRRIQREGIIVAGFFIFGFDGDTVSSVDDFCKFVRDLNITVPFFNLLCPVPGTQIYDHMKKEGRLLAEKVDAYQCHNVIYGAPTHRCLYQPKQMSPRDAELAFVEIRERLASFPAILRRTAGLNPSMAVAVLLLNLACRRETRAVAKAIRKSVS